MEMGVSQNEGYQDYGIGGFLLGYPHLGKLPYVDISVILILASVSWQRTLSSLMATHFKLINSRSEVS